MAMQTRQAGSKEEYNEWTEILQKTGMGMGMGMGAKKKKKIIKVSGKKFYGLSNQG